MEDKIYFWAFRLKGCAKNTAKSIEDVEGMQ